MNFWKYTVSHFITVWKDKNKNGKGKTNTAQGIIKLSYAMIFPPRLPKRKDADSEVVLPQTLPLRNWLCQEVLVQFLVYGKI